MSKEESERNFQAKWNTGMSTSLLPKGLLKREQGVNNNFEKQIWEGEFNLPHCIAQFSKSKKSS